MKPFELREFFIDELDQKLHDLYEEFMAMRFKKSTETPKASEMRRVRKEIARVKTIMREKRQYERTGKTTENTGKI